MIDRLDAALRRARRPVWAALLGALAASYLLVLWVGAPFHGLGRSLCGSGWFATGAHPESAICGVDAAALRAFARALREAGLESRGIVLVAADVPLIAALTAALTALALEATRDSLLGERTAKGLARLPMVFAAGDLAEDGFFLTLYLGADWPIPVLPWVTALKFGLLSASLLSSLVVLATKMSLAGD